MKVLCTINNIYELQDSTAIVRIEKHIHLSDGQLNLEKNEEYCVFGILFRGNSPWYYLCVNDDDRSPTPYPAELFDIVDGRLSSYWKLSTVNYRSGVMSSIVFDEWAKDSSFYERLIDDDPSAIGVFERYRNLINKE